MRIGRIGYINCAPVYGAIDRGIVTLPQDGQLVTGTPAELNDLLVAGELDVSVISAIEYARHARELLLLPDLAISCDGPVRSVALFSRRTVGQLDGRTVLLSASSRTSVALLELLCRDVWHITPKFAEARAEAQDLATLLGEEAVFAGDANRVNTLWPKIAKLTPENIQSAAKKYFQPSRMTVLRYLPDPLGMKNCDSSQIPSSTHAGTTMVVTNTTRIHKQRTRARGKSTA